MKNKLVALVSFSCYCGSDHSFASCCEPVIQGKAVAQNPQQLMRSRYSAYCHHDKNPECYDYILQTYHSSVRALQNRADIVDFAKAVRFVGLRIVSDSTITAQQVHFVASYLVADRLEALEEVSYFEREQGQWMYCSGQLTEHPARKIARNDVCPCGSGVKFKKCSHLR